VTGGVLNERARGLGIPDVEVDGCDIPQVWEASKKAIERAHSGQGPTFLHARCVHLEGHFLGLQLLRVVRDPLRELPEIAGPLTKSFFQPGGAILSERLAGLKTVLAAVVSTLRDPRQDSANDPVWHARTTLQSDPVRLQELEDQIEQEISNVVASVMAEVPA
jgi:hypothetical protein